MELHNESIEKLQKLTENIGNLIFISIEIPGLTAVEATSFIKTAYPDINVLWLALAGNGYILEQVPEIVNSYEAQQPLPVSLITFISRLYEIAMPLNMVVLNKVLAFCNEEKPCYQNGYGLSPREKDILHCLVSGNTYKQIAEGCHISVGTVRSHIMNIYRKLNVNSRSNAIVKAIKEQLI